MDNLSYIYNMEGLEHGLETFFAHMKGSNARFIFANGCILLLAFLQQTNVGIVYGRYIIQILKENHRPVYRIRNQRFALCCLTRTLLKGLSHEIDFKYFGKNLQNLGRDAACF